MRSLTLLALLFLAGCADAPTGPRRDEARPCQHPPEAPPVPACPR